MALQELIRSGERTVCRFRRESTRLWTPRWIPCLLTCSSIGARLRRLAASLCISRIFGMTSNLPWPLITTTTSIWSPTKVKQSALHTLARSMPGNCSTPSANYTYKNCHSCHKVSFLVKFVVYASEITLLIPIVKHPLLIIFPCSSLFFLEI